MAPASSEIFVDSFNWKRAANSKPSTEFSGRDIGAADRDAGRMHH
jgi:hypothetical protein